jgi:pSer/pThr/pTyr-binding forkhead associated (FHA) protein
MQVELAVSLLGGESKTVALEGDRLTLGRASGNHLCFPDDLGLSRQHLELAFEGSEWVLRDLGSKNGTFLNGNRLAGAHRLRPGDRIVASRVALVFDPSRQIEKTVVFEHAEAPSGQTRSVTLGRLLGGDKSAAHWGTPVQALLRAGTVRSDSEPGPGGRGRTARCPADPGEGPAQVAGRAWRQLPHLDHGPRSCAGGEIVAAG